MNTTADTRRTLTHKAMKTAIAEGKIVGFKFGYGIYTVEQPAGQFTNLNDHEAAGFALGIALESPAWPERPTLWDRLRSRMNDLTRDAK